MPTWFSPYDGYDWDFRKGFSEYFKTVVTQPLKDWFSLEMNKSQPGVFNCKANNLWKDYQMMRGVHVFARIEDLDVRLRQLVEMSYVPAFKFRLKLARAVKSRNLLKALFRAIFKTEDGTEQNVELSTFFDEEIYMILQSDPRVELPLFKILNPRYQFGVSHEFHQLSGSWLCILPDSEMRQGRDTVISGLGAAIDWIMWYETRHGNLLLKNLLS